MKVRCIIVLLSALLAVFLAVGCNDPIQEDKPYLSDIAVDVDDVKVEKDGTVELPFHVSQADYVFDSNVGTSGCQLALRFENNEDSQYFSLESVSTTSTFGSYLAVIRDSGVGGNWSCSAQLTLTGTVKTGETVTLLSNKFNVSALMTTSIGTGLPVVHINTAGGKKITSKETFIPATISIEGIEDWPDLEAADIQIRGRGNTTWDWPKKPYLFKFDKKTEVLGMPKHKRWVLLANLMDRTLMRNMTALTVASQTSLAYTPRFVPVELVLNDKHVGTYLLTEQVRVDKNRVNIDEKDGLLLELDFHGDNDVQWIDPHGSCWERSSGIPFAIKSPDVEDLTADRIKEVKDYIWSVADVIYGSKFADKNEGYAKYLDVQSFADYWIVYELMGNHEINNPGSVYMHKDKDGLLTAGPIWDFDWGVLSFNTSPQARTGLLNDRAIWYSRLLQDPEFKHLVKTRWDALLPMIQTIPDYMENTREFLRQSAQLNFKMWNPADDRWSNGGQIINGDENLSYDAAIDRLISNYKSRVEVISSKISGW